MTRSIQDRLDLVEDQLRRLRRLLNVIKVSFIVGSVLGCSQIPRLLRLTGAGRTSEASEFVLVDDSGSMSGIFSSGARSDPHLFLYDAGRRRLVQVATDANGRCGLGLYDAKGRARVGLVYSGLATDECGLSLMDASGRLRAYLGSRGGDGDMRLELYDAEGRRKGLSD